jgi:hypothetical protein
VLTRSKIALVLAIIFISFGAALYSTQLTTNGITSNTSMPTQTFNSIAQSLTTSTHFATTTSTSFLMTTNSSKLIIQAVIVKKNANNVTPAASISPPIGFDQQELSAINSTANKQVSFIESLQLPNGAIEESPGVSLVYPRDLALAIVALTVSGQTLQARAALNFLVSLQQISSQYSSDNSYDSSPPAWAQVYTTNGKVVDPSLRGEDQGMVLFAISTFIQKTGDISFARDHWSQIENSANFILYLQGAPEPNAAHNGLYRHGDNWHDTRSENMNGTQPIYWPYWPEYYQWEEENMRMITGLRGAVSLATELGGKATDAFKWSNSVDIALIGLSNESMYGKYEAYDYFGSVLWQIQTNIQLEKKILANVPSSFFTPYGVKDLPWNSVASVSDTIDYMLCLVRVGNYTGASNYLNLIAAYYIDPAGGFYDATFLSGSHSYDSQQVYSSARFVYFAYVVSTLSQ